jgi:hypothetical protein
MQTRQKNEKSWKLNFPIPTYASLKRNAAQGPDFGCFDKMVATDHKDI